jgi:HPt (histidine-containing phosphotransfer) domain-containing protein
MEKPNLDYIEKLAMRDESIRNKLIAVLKIEFPEEKKEYYKSLKNKDFKEIEENVHRLKHTISILGMEKSYAIANEFEHNLRNLNLDRVDYFDQILVTISSYLKTI